MYFCHCCKVRLNPRKVLTLYAISVYKKDEKDEMWLLTLGYTNCFFFLSVFTQE